MSLMLAEKIQQLSQHDFLAIHFKDVRLQGWLNYALLEIYIVIIALILCVKINVQISGKICRPLQKFYYQKPLEFGTEKHIYIWLLKKQGKRKEMGVKYLV